MICNTKLKKRMKFTQTVLYQRCYKYVCSDGYVITIVDTSNKEKSKDLKNTLLKKVKTHLLEKGLNE